MKICIYGAGAIGGYLGVQLLRAGADVSLVARGAHLAAMRENGLKLLMGEETHIVHPRCTDNAAELGAQDFVIICLKAHSIPAVIGQMKPLLGPQTRIVTAVNGIPYWYFYRHGGVHEGATLESIDPGGRQWREFGPERAIGCIVYPATEIEAPGVVRHVYGNQFPLGEPSGEMTDDIRRLAAQAIAERFGVTFRVDVERRIEGARKVGAHKTSMLQDLERGRPMEIDPLVTVVQEMGRLTGIATPALDAVLALVAQRGKIAGLYAANVRPAETKAPAFA
jgi:2-dehydropantoate 2-reductase